MHLPFGAACCSHAACLQWASNTALMACLAPLLLLAQAPKKEEKKPEPEAPKATVQVRLLIWESREA